VPKKRKQENLGRVRVVWVLFLVLSFAGTSFAQSTKDDDAVLKLAEPDFTLVSLPTALRLPRGGSAVRFTHRFALPLKGSVGSLADSLFGLDSSATVGLEWRMGVVKNGQVGLHRSSSDRMLELFGEYGLVRQGHASPVDFTLRSGVEGVDNFRSPHAESLMVIVSRLAGQRAAFYVEPEWVHNAQAIPPVTDSGANVVMIGLAARVRVRRTVYLVAEYSPVVAGDNGRTDHGAFAIEKRVGGHVFQFNVSNSFATTPAQMAHGADPANDWHIGFNISRKLF
jgi:Membrane bound beta barrel domain (DUF5777)